MGKRGRSREVTGGVRVGSESRGPPRSCAQQLPMCERHCAVAAPFPDCNRTGGGRLSRRPPHPTSWTTHPKCDTWGSPAQRPAFHHPSLPPPKPGPLRAGSPPHPGPLPRPEVLAQRGGRAGDVCLDPRRAQRKSEVWTQSHTHASLFLTGNPTPPPHPSAARSGVCVPSLPLGVQIALLHCWASRSSELEFFSGWKLTMSPLRPEAG